VHTIPPVKPGARLNLAKIDPDQAESFPKGKEAGMREFARLQEALADLQERFYVARRYKLLVVLQGMDTSGKSGTLRAVFRAANPQGVSVASFKRPTPEELAHDYLWRVHHRAPADGEMVIFDRSHYEDITAVRVNGLKPRAVWSKRFDHIREFERMLADEGTIILKFFLHIDRDEQKRRLESRLREPKKRWKFELGDLEARRHWDQYMEAYAEAITRTTDRHAPWYIVPANRKWVRNLIVASVIIERLKKLELSFPKIELNPKKIRID
jgi:PPK2 family polyphosphate:nucleotide phosphotransferase